MIIDATCCPADIRFPTDMSILNEARENTERIIDYLFSRCKIPVEKPRDYRIIAHKDFVTYTKKRKHTNKTRRAAIRKQLNYLRRNMGHINRLLDGVELSQLPYRITERLRVLDKVLSQQTEMYRNNERKVENRIVSISQPYVRPIIRGKAGCPVEFGAKISLGLYEGYSFIDRLSWDAYNEAGDLIPQIKKYHERFGHYPESVHADKIYQNRDNRAWCKSKGIRITGKPLGRPVKETMENKNDLAATRKQRYQDDIDRIAIEGRFGVAKRKYGLDLIKSKLKETSETEIYMTIMITNLDMLCASELNQNRNRYKIQRRKAA